MTTSLLNLIDAAQMLADPTAYVQRGRAWHMEGGRSCPIGWHHCSQPVFMDRVTGEWDYGEKGGPGAEWCANNCPEGLQPPEDGA